MKVRCLGGPLDDTDVEVSDPPPLNLCASLPFNPMLAQLDFPEVAEYRLERMAYPWGEASVRYVCTTVHKNAMENE